MDITRRQITKIAREISKFTVRMLKADGIGTAEYDFIHVVRKNPGITQAGIREVLGLDKGATARRCSNLEAKGYLRRIPNPKDGRSSQLYATEKAQKLKVSKSFVETLSYEWLTEDLSEQDRQEFARILDLIYQKSKAESRADFVNLKKRFWERRTSYSSTELTYSEEKETLIKVPVKSESGGSKESVKRAFVELESGASNKAVTNIQEESKSEDLKERVLNKFEESESEAGENQEELV